MAPPAVSFAAATDSMEVSRARRRRLWACGDHKLAGMGGAAATSAARSWRNLTAEMLLDCPER